MKKQQKWAANQPLWQQWSLIFLVPAHTDITKQKTVSQDQVNKDFVAKMYF